MYIVKKGLDFPHPEKSRSEFYLTVAQLQTVLDEVQRQDKQDLKRDLARRDHAAIFLGFYLGLRVGEAAILERESLRHIDDGTIYVKTLKNIPRLRVTCAGCGRRCRVSVKRAGQQHLCRCGKENLVHAPRNIDLEPPEKEPPVVEPFVLEYAAEYLATLPKGQRWLFEGQKGMHLSNQQLSRIFGHYVISAGLSNKYSWHSLRHGRGLLIWETFKDHVMLRDSLRQKSLSAAEFYMHLSPARRAEYADKLAGKAVKVGTWQAHEEAEAAN
jgi:site-specific recombinase XerD